ncbi:flavin reductase domain protein, FMN-binding protein [Thermoproteus uzoniensis 768-20]|uniref:Flavin reductase domain protein, FMN-binding protein n=1 Tax=Thermoproteus uzoniensis (strain 768-20) TaxID=999630 RepID=F2L3L0_THEU7|nr:flavin reductase family protein [Thermoproteus uzoniensis]AEA13249.1 flavin reductase domain protein, FMN-binding protein [Thermoproteus uzoniensis 768-20]
MYAEYKGKFYRPLHPRPTVVVVSKCPDGKINAMPASWNTPVSEEPPTIAVAVDRSAYTFQCLEHSGEATINVVPADMADLAYALGSVSGRDVDKVSAFGLKLLPSDVVEAPGLDGSIAVYEARVTAKLDIGEVRLYVFEVLKVKVAQGLVDEWGPVLDKTNLLLHGAGRVFYRVDPRKIWAKKPAGRP